MLLKTSVDRLFLSICSVGTICLCSGVEAARSEALSASVISLSPSESSQFDAQRSEVGLGAIADNINTGVEVDRQLAEEAAKAGTLDFEDLPLIGTLLENEGKVPMGGGLPLSFSVGSVMGSYGVVMNADF